MKLKKLISCLLLAVMVLTVLPLSSLATAQGTEIVLEKSKGNPFLGFDANGELIYGADPAVLVDGDTCYVYVGQDASVSGGFNIIGWNAYSSKDMENWTFEGTVMSPTKSHVPWYTGNANLAYAAQPVKYFDRELEQDFYYYYYSHGGDFHIGVGVADTPTGWSSMEAKLEYCAAKGIDLTGRNYELPESERLYFTDIGQPLIRNPQTWPHVNNFDDIDPTAWVDGDTRYLLWGNAMTFIAELNEDMISLKDKDGNGLITMKTDRSFLTKDGSVALRYTGGNNRNLCSQLVEKTWTYPQTVTYWDYKKDTDGNYIPKTIPEGASYPNGDIVVTRHRTANKYNYQLDTPYDDDARTIASTADHNRGNMTGLLTYNDANDNPIPAGDTTTEKAWLNGTYNWRWNELEQTYDPSFCFLCEAPYLYRRQDENGNYYGKYYMLFAQDNPQKLAYSTTDDPMSGVWDFQGAIMPCTGTAGTNHPSMFDFKGQTYLISHDGSLPFGGSNRSAYAERLYFDENGAILPVMNTATGLTGFFSWLRDSNGDYITHENFNDTSNPNRWVKMLPKSDMVDKYDCRWEIVKPQARKATTNPSLVSIEAWNKPGRYLKAMPDNSVVMAIMGNGRNMTEEALVAIEESLTFRTLAGFNSNPDAVTFESVAFPGMYLSSVNGNLVLTDGSDRDACSLTIGTEKLVVDTSFEPTGDATTNITNGSGTETLKGYVIQALYKDGKLEKLVRTPYEIAPNTTGAVETSLDLSEGLSGNYLRKCFVWDENLKPIDFPAKQSISLP